MYDSSKVRAMVIGMGSEPVKKGERKVGVLGLVPEVFHV